MKYVILAVALISAVGFIAVHQLRLWWARFHTVPMEMYQEQLAERRRINENAYQALCEAANMAGDLESFAIEHRLRGNALGPHNRWNEQADAFTDHLISKVLPLLEPHERHQLSYIDLDDQRITTTQTDKRIDHLREPVKVLRSLLDRYAMVR